MCVCVSVVVEEGVVVVEEEKEGGWGDKDLLPA